MINKERIKLLVDDLRTTTVEQATGHLRTIDGKFCCLGRACEVAIKSGCKVEVNGISYDNYGSYLPPSVQEWYGFDRSDPTLHYKEFSTSATGLNDGEKASFKVIADEFEREYLK